MHAHQQDAGQLAGCWSVGRPAVWSNEVLEGAFIRGGWSCLLGHHIVYANRADKGFHQKCYINLDGDKIYYLADFRSLRGNNRFTKNR